MGKPSLIELPAIQIRQGKHVLYSFAVDGKRLGEFTTVTHVGRQQDWTVGGYQRPEIIKHIAEIRAYLDTGTGMLPNSLVIAFDERVRFRELNKVGDTAFGVLTVPAFGWDGRDRACGFVVDGQQRRAAIRESRLKKFPVFCTGFVTASEQDKREQFILVNNAKPLPRTLIYELLPGTEAVLPVRLTKQRVPVKLCERMNLDLDSPLSRLIATPTLPNGLMKDNSFLKMLGHSLSDGVLFRYRGDDEGADDLEGMVATLKNFWLAVSRTFPTEWAKPPRFCRLFAGSGVVALGFIMDAIADGWLADGTAVPSATQYQEALQLIKPYCRWSDGTWEFGRRWNEIQNTPADVALVANFIARKFAELLRQRATPSGHRPAVPDDATPTVLA